MPAVGFALIASCAGLAAPDAESDVARAAGLEQAVLLRVEGDAVDAEPATGSELALADAVRLAVERDPAIQAALARVREAFAEAKGARLLPNPILSIVLRLPEGGGRAEIETGVTAELAALLQRPRRIDAADRRLSAAVEDALLAGLDAVAGVREGYAVVQARDELLPSFRERAALLARLFELAQSRLELGEAARIDVTAIRTQQIELDVEIADIELGRRVARLALARLLGEPSSPADWELEPWAPLPDRSPDEKAWIAAALERRPEIRSRAWELAALGDEAALAALARLDGSAFGIAAERSDEWAAGPELALPLPIFDLGGARRDGALARIIAARHELVGISRRVVLEVRRELASFAAVSAALARVRDELIPLQRERREEVEAIYLAGLTDVTAVLFAEQNLQAAQAKQVELEESAAVALVRLERAVGGPVVANEVRQADSEARVRP